MLLLELTNGQSLPFVFKSLHCLHKQVVGRVEWPEEGFQSGGVGWDHDRDRVEAEPAPAARLEPFRVIRADQRDGSAWAGAALQLPDTGGVGPRGWRSRR